MWEKPQFYVDLFTFIAKTFLKKSLLSFPFGKSDFRFK